MNLQVVPLQGIYEDAGVRRREGFGIDGGASFDKPSYLLVANATEGFWWIASFIFGAGNGQGFLQ